MNNYTIFVSSRLLVHIVTDSENLQEVDKPYTLTFGYRNCISAGYRKDIGVKLPGGMHLHSHGPTNSLQKGINVCPMSDPSFNANEVEL